MSSADSDEEGTKLLKRKIRPQKVDNRTYFKKLKWQVGMIFGSMLFLALIKKKCKLFTREHIKLDCMAH